MTRHELKESQHCHAMIAVGKVSGIITTGAVDTFAYAFNKFLMFSREHYEGVRAVVIHRVSLGKRPSAGGSKVTRSPILRISHLAFLQYSVLVPQS